jgi:hypothetical protein
MLEMNRTLIAVTTCEKFRAKADACRATWARRARSIGFDVRFFVGLDKAYGEPREFDDTVVLPCQDDYLSLPAKVKETMIWSIAKGYDFTYKVDDDTFLIPERLAEAYKKTHSGRDYVGNFRESFQSPKGYASGFCYGLSRKAAEVVACSEVSEDTNEDRWVGAVLRARLNPFNSHDEKRFSWCTFLDPAGAFLSNSIPGKTFIAFAEYTPQQLVMLNTLYKRYYGVWE